MVPFIATVLVPMSFHELYLTLCYCVVRYLLLLPFVADLSSSSPKSEGTAAFARTEVTLSSTTLSTRSGWS